MRVCKVVRVCGTIERAEREVAGLACKLTKVVQNDGLEKGLFETRLETHRYRTYMQKIPAPRLFRATTASFVAKEGNKMKSSAK